MLDRHYLFWLLILPLMAFFTILAFEPHEVPNILAIRVPMKVEQAFTSAVFVFAIVAAVRAGYLSASQAFERIVTEALRKRDAN